MVTKTNEVLDDRVMNMVIEDRILAGTNILYRLSLDRSMAIE